MRRALVAELVRVSLVEQAEPGWFTVHPLVRAYATEPAAAEPVGPPATHARLDLA